MNAYNSMKITIWHAHKILHVSDLTGPSSESTTVQNRWASEAWNKYKPVCCNIVILIKLCAFIGSNCNNWTVMHRMENVKIYQYFSKFIHTLLWSSRNTWTVFFHAWQQYIIKKISAFTICFHKFFAFIMAFMYSTVSKRLQLTAAGKLSQTPEPIFSAQHLFGSTNL